MFTAIPFGRKVAFCFCMNDICNHCLVTFLCRMYALLHKEYPCASDKTGLHKFFDLDFLVSFYLQATLALALDILLSEESGLVNLQQGVGRLINAIVAVLGPELSPGSIFFSRCKVGFIQIQEV